MENKLRYAPGFLRFHPIKSEFLSRGIGDEIRLDCLLNRLTIWFTKYADVILSNSCFTIFTKGK